MSRWLGILLILGSLAFFFSRLGVFLPQNEDPEKAAQEEELFSQMEKYHQTCENNPDPKTETICEMMKTSIEELRNRPKSATEYYKQKVDRGVASLLKTFGLKKYCEPHESIPLHEGRGLWPQIKESMIDFLCGAETIRKADSYNEDPTTPQED